MTTLLEATNKLLQITELQHKLMLERTDTYGANTREAAVVFQELVVFLARKEMDQQ